MLLKLVPRQLNGTSRSCCLVHIGRRADYIELTALLSLIASLPHDGLKMSLWQDDCYNSGNLCKIVKYWKRLPKSKRPSSKSYERLKNGVENELTPAQLEVFCFVTNILKTYLTFFQSSAPQITFLSEEMQKCLNELMVLVVKADVIFQGGQDPSWVYYFRYHPRSSQQDFIPLDKITMGASAEDKLRELINEDSITNSS